MFQKITSNDPYELDWIVGKISYIEIKIPALTTKNAKYIDSGIRNSNYDINIECGEKYLEALCKRKSFSQKPDDDRYIGSPFFWFNAMKTNVDICGEKVGFNIYLKGALHSINLLTSNGCSRESVNKVAEELYKKCNSVKCLRNMLSKPYSSKDAEHIVAIITKTYDLPNQKDKNKLALASKFCSIASEFLFDKVKPFYPKYDSIVAENLGYYISFYLQTNCYKGKYPKQLKNNFKVGINFRSRTAYTEYLKIYEAYIWFIRKILSKISKVPNKTQRISITASQFTHLIKYADKFKKSEIFA